jgi:hypothetical protein
MDQWRQRMKEFGKPMSAIVMQSYLAVEACEWIEMRLDAS